MHTLRAIVNQNQSAGLLVRLDAEGTPSGLGPVFDLRDEANRVAPPPPLVGTTRDLLGRHGSSRYALVAEGAALVGQRSIVCPNLMNRTLDANYDGGFHEIVGRMFNDATGRYPEVPGMIGIASCRARNNVQSQRVVVRGGRSFGDMLQTAVTQAPATAWLLVETLDGRCGLGVILAAADSADPCLITDRFRERQVTGSSSTCCATANQGSRRASRSPPSPTWRLRSRSRRATACVPRPARALQLVAVVSPAPSRGRRPPRPSTPAPARIASSGRRGHGRPAD